MAKKITITINNDGFTYEPNDKVNRNSKVTFQLGANRVSAEVTLDPDCFEEPSITLNRLWTSPVISKEVGIKPNVPNGTYGFSTPEIPILEAGQLMSKDKDQSKSKSKSKGEEGGTLVGDVEVVPDGGVNERVHGRRGASVTAAEQGLTAG